MKTRVILTFYSNIKCFMQVLSIVSVRYNLCTKNKTKKNNPSVIKDVFNNFYNLLYEIDYYLSMGRLYSYQKIVRMKKTTENDHWQRVFYEFGTKIFEDK